MLTGNTPYMVFLNIHGRNRSQDALILSIDEYTLREMSIQSVMELVRGDGPTWPDTVRCSSRMRRKLGELPIKKKLACALAGAVSPGTWSCADDKGPPRKEVGG
jgi:hypothetical protein